MFRSIVISLVLAFFIAGCGESIQSNNPEILGRPYKSLKKVGETESILFLNPLPGDDRNKITVRFKVADQGSLKLIANSDNQLSGGLEFLFERKGKRVRPTLTLGNREVDLSMMLEGKIGDPEGEMAVQIEIHNREQGEPGAHIILRQENGTSIEEIDGEASPGHGAGVFWGFELNKSQIQQLKAERGSEEG